MKKLLNATPILFTSKGFTYNGDEYRGQYSAIYALSNIYNENSCITVIAYSTPACMERNFFLRNMILPSASNGFHPYLNQNLLVKTESDYFCAKRLGDDLVSVKQFTKTIPCKESSYTVSWDMSDYEHAISLITMNVVNKRIEGGALKADGWGGDPNLTAVNTNIDAGKFKYLAIEYMNDSSSKVAQLFFSQTSRYDFCEEKSIVFIYITLTQKIL